MKDEYELSKDYQRLFALISDGYRVVCYVDYDTRIEGTVLRDVCSVRLKEDGSFGFGVRGLEYIGNYSSVLTGFDGFKDVCEQANVEFVDPDREKRLVEALEHYANEDFWYCNTQHIHDIDNPECCADSYNQDGNGYEVAAKALADHKGEK